MTYQLPKVEHPGNEIDLLRYEGTGRDRDRPYRFTTLLGYHPGTEICLGITSVENVIDKLQPGLKFVLHRTKYDEDGCMLQCDPRY